MMLVARLLTIAEESTVLMVAPTRARVVCVPWPVATIASSWSGLNASAKSCEIVPACSVIVAETDR